MSFISVNNDRLKLAVCEARGIQELLRVVDAVGHAATTGGPGGKSKHELLEPAVCALRHLTNNHKVTDDGIGQGYGNVRSDDRCTLFFFLLNIESICH